jgi:hypothetical protein
VDNRNDTGQCKEEVPLQLLKASLVSKKVWSIQKYRRGKRCKLTGARCDVDVGSSETDLALFTGLGLEVRHDLPSAEYQVSKEFCAVNSVAILIDLPLLEPARFSSELSSYFFWYVGSLE